jgi:hypothetical protein
MIGGCGLSETTWLNENRLAGWAFFASHSIGGPIGDFR